MTIFYKQSWKLEMQTKFYQNYTTAPKLLQKSTSVPSFSETTNSSTNSIESIDDEYRRSAIKWLLAYNRKVAKDTHYLAISYLHQLIRKSIYICQDNYQTIAVTLLLLAAKMNEIYPPKISSMLAKCRKTITKEDILMMESRILQSFNFDIALDSTPYTHLMNILGSTYNGKLQECEKLLRIVASYREIYQFGDQILAYSIIYLIIPQFVREMKLKQNQKVKTLAIKIYTIYTQTKQKYEVQKENRFVQ